jgi:hypothetical protein
MDQKKSEDQVIIVSDIKTLNVLGARGSFTRPVRGKIILRLATLSTEELLDWQQRLTHVVFACGCGMAAGTGLSSLILFSAWRILASPTTRERVM